MTARDIYSFMTLTSQLQIHENAIEIGLNLNQGARSEFFLGGVASRVSWGWRDSYGRTGNFGRVGDKSMFKMYK